MPAKYLGQIVAILKDGKTQAERALTDAHHALQKPEMLSGISREYQPLADDGEQLPAESKLVQVTVEEMIQATKKHLARLFDMTAARDFTNGPGGPGATADVEIDGQVLVENAPVPYLLWLERQLQKLHTFTAKLPTLDPATTWTLDDAVRGVYVSEVQETVRQVKQPRSFELSPATKEHPAQVRAWEENVVVGKWRSVRYSGAVPQQRRAEILEQIEKAQRAVHLAREQANRTEALEPVIGKNLLDFVFGS